jgi:hypothetical protein
MFDSLRRDNLIWSVGFPPLNLSSSRKFHVGDGILLTLRHGTFRFFASPERNLHLKQNYAYRETLSLSLEGSEDLLRTFRA